MGVGEALLWNQKFHVWKPPKLLRDPSWSPSPENALIHRDISARLKTQNNPGNPRAGGKRRVVLFHHRGAGGSGGGGRLLARSSRGGSDSLELFLVLKDKKKTKNKTTPRTYQLLYDSGRRRPQGCCRMRSQCQLRGTFRGKNNSACFHLRGSF